MKINDILFCVPHNAFEVILNHESNESAECQFYSKHEQDPLWRKQGPRWPCSNLQTWPCVSEKTQTAGSQFRALYDITTGLSTAEGPPLEPDWEMNGLVPEQGSGRKETISCPLKLSLWV